MSYYMDFCADCDRAVRRTPMGWYRCDRCGHESLRAPLVTSPGVIGDDLETLHASSPAVRRPQAGAGLVSFSIKGEKQ